MSQTKKKQAVIAGSGVAGLSAAVFLDELGYDVILIEKKPILGGRTYSFKDKKTDFTVDNGQHLLIGAYHETIKFIEAIGAKRFLNMDIPTQVPLLDETFHKAFFTIGKLKAPLHLAKAVFTYKNFSFLEKLQFLRIANNVKKILKNKANYPDHLTVREWLIQNHQSKNTQKNFWDILTLATLNDSPDKTSADGLVQVLLNSYFTEQNNGYLIFPKVGLSELFVEPTKKYLKMRGQSIIQGNAVEEIKVLNNQVQCFILKNGDKIKADLYVSAMPFSPLLKALPKAFVSGHTSLKDLHKLQSSPIVSINLFYDEVFMTEKFVGSAATNVHWFFSKNHIFHEDYDDMCHIMGVISGAYDYIDMSKDEIVKFAKTELEKIYPQAKHAELVHALVNKEREATLSSRPGINALRPKQKVLDNFYIVGDWTQTGLPATIESAIKSSRMMVDGL